MRWALETHEEIPDGNKSGGVQFIVANPNVDNFKTKKRFRHPRDDKSSYGGSSTEVVVFEMTERGYLSRKAVEVNGKMTSKLPSVKIFLNPLGDKNIFTVYRVSYPHLEMSLSKNFIYFVECPVSYARIKDKVFVYYIGEDTMEGLSQHGNVEFTNKEYRAPSAKTLNLAEQMIIQKVSQTEIMDKLDDSNKPQSSIQTTHQLNKMRQRLKKIDEENNGNETDQMFRLLSHVAAAQHDYAKQVVMGSGCGMPSLMLYFPFQSSDAVR